MTPNLPAIPEMRRAVLARDASYDGLFYLAVRTTGIFCRPSCPARKPKPENVEYFPTARDAILAGYRPCRRCRPMDAGGATPEWVAGLIERVERDPATRFSDNDIRAMGIEPERVRRFFRSRFGMTFQAYSRGRRMSAALDAIRRGADLDDVVFDHGYESHSGFRDAFARTFGTAPGRARGRDCVSIAPASTPLGPMVLGATSDTLCLAEFATRRMLERQLETLRRRLRCAIVPGANGVLEQAQAELDEYFAGRRMRFDVPVCAPGTPFQERVWSEVSAIEYGRSRSYESIARSVGRPGAARAVGTANGMNRIAIVIPCHRVVKKDGGLGGYGGGRWRKQALLDLERGGPTEKETKT